MHRIVRELRGGEAKSTGKLHGELYPKGGLDRDGFEEVLGAMARAGLARLADAVFEKDGRSIPYRKVALTVAGADVKETEGFDLLMRDSVTQAIATKPRKRVKKTKPAAKSKPDKDANLEAKLRAWRMAEAKRRGVPAFRIFSDQTLAALAAKRPATARELLAIPGIGMNTVEKMGAQIFRILHEHA